MDITENTKFRNKKPKELKKEERKKQAYFKRFKENPEDTDQKTRIKRQILYKYDDDSRSYKKRDDVSSSDMGKKMKEIKLRLKKWKKMMSKKQKQSN